VRLVVGGGGAQVVSDPAVSSTVVAGPVEPLQRPEGVQVGQQAEAALLGQRERRRPGRGRLLVDDEVHAVDVMHDQGPPHEGVDRRSGAVDVAEELGQEVGEGRVVEPPGGRGAEEIVHAEVDEFAAGVQGEGGIAAPGVLGGRFAGLLAPGAEGVQVPPAAEHVQVHLGEIAIEFPGRTELLVERVCGGRVEVGGVCGHGDS